MTARDAIARTKIGPLAHVIAEMLERAGEQRPNGDILHDILMQALPAASPHMPVPPGWVLVPEEPTCEMLDAAGGSGALALKRRIWRDMLSARPKGGA